MDDSKMLDACNDVKDIPEERGGPGYSDWELEFLDSIEDQMGSGRRLSAKQRTILADLYDRS